MYREDSKAFKVTVRIFDAFIGQFKEKNMIPVVVIFPYRKDVKAYRKTQRKSYAPLVEHFDRKGYRYIDVMDIFAHHAQADRPHKGLFKGGHYSPRGNQRVAQMMLEYLQTQQLIR